MPSPIAAVFLNAVVCTNSQHTTCMPPQFVWAPPKYIAEHRQVNRCEFNARALNAAQDDKSILYRCEDTRGA